VVVVVLVEQMAKPQLQVQAVQVAAAVVVTQGSMQTTVQLTQAVVVVVLAVKIQVLAVQAL
jgi:hypothetical protein